MKRFDAIIIGGGVAGATCALHLEQSGARVAVIERRAKLGHNITCSGVFDSTFALWDTTIEAYPGEILHADYEDFRLIIAGLAIKGTANALSRPFFDESLHFLIRGQLEQWLLERSGATLFTGCNVARDAIEYDPGATPRYTVHTSQGAIHGDHLIGAGATHDVVRRRFFQRSKRSDKDLIVLLEAEVEGPLPHDRYITHLSYGGRRGLGWIYPKGEGGRLVNFGVAATRASLGDLSLKKYWSSYLDRVISDGLLDARHRDARAHGGSIYMAQDEGPLRTHADSCFIIGDAAGLLYRDFWNGITPAAESARLAAHHICGRGVYARRALSPYLFRLRGRPAPGQGALREWIFRAALPSVARLLERRR